MKQLLRKPFLLAILLSLPLWVVLNNYLVALFAALLVSFLLAMAYALFAVQGKKQRDADPANVPDDQTN